MKIAIGNDHAGTEYKLAIIGLLKSMGIEVINHGTDGSDSVDYADFVHPVAIEVEKGNADFGIIICGSGIGISIAANKIKGVRAALCTTVDHAIMSRKHNDSNILAVGARLTSYKDIINILNEWLKTDFEAGRHLLRINQIEDIK